MFSDGCTLTFVGETPSALTFDARRHPRVSAFSALAANPSDSAARDQRSLWNQCLASHTVIRSTVDGEPYENQFGHFLRLRWGKVVDDLIIEDTQRWERACRRLIAAGVDEAAAAPMT
jgi:ketosteroid isomerase-like protein